jgi:hypothetical protein
MIADNSACIDGWGWSSTGVDEAEGRMATVWQ